MARILAYVAPSRGHLFPLTPILDELHSRGHTISLRTVGDTVSMMQARGFDAAPTDPAIEAITFEDYHSRNPRKALAASCTTIVARAQLEAPDLRNAIASEQPDALLIDINTWGAFAVAEAWGGPWAAFCHYPLPVESADAPPFGPGFSPARGLPGRLRDRLVRPLITGAVEAEMLPPINRVRGAANLPELDRAASLFTRPQVLLYMTSEPFDYPRSDWPESVVMVGPCAWEPPAERPEWLVNNEKPIVLVTTSSEFQDDGQLVTAALEALADKPVQVVATVPAGNPSDFEIPANARVEKFIPHSALLDQAICAVTHGGMGATQKALARGVPVCAVPFGRDQKEVARRVEVSGCGTQLKLKRLNPNALRKKIDQAIECKPGAERIAAAFEATGGARTAADAVEQRLLN
jgi:MGT family glycosyltransferase